MQKKCQKYKETTHINFRNQNIELAFKKVSKKEKKSFPKKSMEKCLVRKKNPQSNKIENYLPQQ